MRITSLGHSPTNQINQNYKSKQQNAPAFKGEIIGFTNSSEYIPQLWKRIKDVGLYIQSQTHKSAFVRSEIVGLKKNSAILSFDSSFDNEAKKLVDSLNEEASFINIPVSFKFKPNTLLN